MVEYIIGNHLHTNEQAICDWTWKKKKTCVRMCASFSLTPSLFTDNDDDDFDSTLIIHGLFQALQARINKLINSIRWCENSSVFVVGCYYQLIRRSHNSFNWILIWMANERERKWLRPVDESIGVVNWA